MSTPISQKLLTDAVMASYIHEISIRHRPEDKASGDSEVAASSDERTSAAPGG